MNCIAIYLSVVLIYYLTYSFQCLKAIPERAEIVFYNSSIIEDNPTFNVRRYSRKGEYVINLVFVSTAVMDNAVSVDIIFYEYLHNEYRRSFPEMHFKLCDLINSDPYVGKTMRDAGLSSCPILPGKHAITNMTFNHIIPSVWPFERGMTEFIIKHTNTSRVAVGKLFLKFKQ
ncbi:uncharacterized protein LOC124632793 [Helicoverpa zea]|uniref:uncharacterized protein LOC124632793 n=1 Tax=Helicoverpa zea TaxID=7113 RepID=UPI001F597593|nr:uncharacterized protein LOC124632793 [Helicoverpa zea]